MNVFWRAEPLSEVEQGLLVAVLEAHARSAMRGNASTQIAMMAAGGSGSYVQALSAALLSVGGLHAPLVQTMRFLSSSLRVVDVVKAGLSVPGWGNSFIRGRADDLWTGADEYLGLHYTNLAARLNGVTAELQALGKNIFPNPSAYTAAAALALNLPEEAAPWLFVTGRLDAWSGIITEQIKKGAGELWAG